MGQGGYISSHQRHCSRISLGYNSTGDLAAAAWIWQRGFGNLKERVFGVREVRWSVGRTDGRRDGKTSKREVGNVGLCEIEGGCGRWQISVCRQGMRVLDWWMVFLIFGLVGCEGLALEVARWLEEGGWIEGGISLCDMCLMERWVCD